MTYDINNIEFLLITLENGTVLITDVNFETVGTIPNPKNVSVSQNFFC
jgi:hypothetical protein